MLRQDLFRLQRTAFCETFAPFSAYQEMNADAETNLSPAAASNGKGRAEVVMGAEYNWIIDNTLIRVALNVFAFAAWVGVAVAVMAVA